MFKAALRRVVAITPYRIVHNRGANRFGAFDTCLLALKERGYSPRIVIDGGAHLGSFSLETERVFPDAEFHLIEPQAACHERLGSLAIDRGYTLHTCALSDKNGPVPFPATDKPSSGACVCECETSVQAATLDTIFPGLRPDHRALLKLDLQGHEMPALCGGANALKATEVILTEVTFFRDGAAPNIPALISFLAEQDFHLYDIASLNGRYRDNRLKQGDFIFVRVNSPLYADRGWS